MTPERWQQVKAVLDAALERKPQERAAFISKACDGDEPLRPELESLIVSHEQAGSFIEDPAVESLAEIITDKGESLVNRALGSYQVQALLGAGGMGEVYLAEDTRLGRRLALKLLPAHLSGDKERLRRFQQEARAASSLNHPNILTIHEIGAADDRPFIATEFIEGETLRQRLTEGRMEFSEALDISRQVASALSAAHAAGIVHRDIKPENIMIRRDGFVKVLDFGLVKLTEERAADSEAPTLVNTAAGVVMGTSLPTLEEGKQ
jgi:serine/threonine protein kinase